jgi:hypothetical protein
MVLYTMMMLLSDCQKPAIENDSGLQADREEIIMNPRADMPT